MAQDNRTRLKQWLETGEARLQPLTFPQRELWETSPTPIGDPANYICCFIEVRGAITLRNCEAALQRVIERQEALRISFLPGKERPVQLIRAAGAPVLHFRELSSSEARPAALEELTQQAFRMPLDIVQGPLYRVELLRRAHDDHVLVLSIHHAIADGWTLGVFVQDLCVAYMLGLRGVSEPLPPAPLSYTAWGAAERAFWQPALLASRASFWRPRLAGSRRLFGASDRLRSAAAPLRRRVSLADAELSGAVRNLARSAGATLFSTLLASFQLTLSKWTGAEDILVGTPVANRSKEATHETMGYFAGIVPLRGQVDGNQPFPERVRAAHHETVECFANSMPFAELAQVLGASGSAGQHSIFDVRFALQNHPIPDFAMPGLSAKLRMRSTGTARFDLGCEVTEQGEELEVVWLARQDMFSTMEIEELDTLFLRVLANVCRAPEGRPAALMA
jgi:hypothetical protein